MHDYLNFFKMKKTVIITGGNRGIGLDITTSFVEAGYKVYVTGRNEYDLKIYLISSIISIILNVIYNLCIHFN